MNSSYPFPACTFCESSSGFFRSSSGSYLKKFLNSSRAVGSLGSFRALTIDIQQR
jgi:hypothetical protein